MTMNNEERNDLIEATNALSLTTASLEKRIAGLDDDLRRIKGERKAGIDALVAQMLPDLRQSTFDKLRAAAPRFVDAEVNYLISRKWYTLYFFQRQGYYQALTTLRTRMAFAAGKGLLPQIAERIEDWNQGIDSLQAERGELALRQRNVLASLDLLRAAAGKSVRLPPQAKRDVQIIVQKARAARHAAQAAKSVHVSHSATGSAMHHPNHAVIENHNAEVVYVDNVDVWSNFAADVPQSLALMAFEAMRQTHQANPMDDSGRIASGGSDSGIDFAYPSARAMSSGSGSDIDFGDAPAARGAASGSDIDFGDDSAATSRAALATDDRLGSFS